jgi:hypothetical protein
MACHDSGMRFSAMAMAMAMAFVCVASFGALAAGGRAGRGRPIAARVGAGVGAGVGQVTGVPC